MRTHLFQKDPENGPDWKGRYRCFCRMPEEHAVHDIPDRSDEDISDRIIGEGDDFERGT